MKVVNDTRFDTRELRRILCAVHRDESRKRGKMHRWRDLAVTVSYAKRGNRGYTGHAYFSGWRAHLSIPRGTANRAEVAALWHHELLHLYGLRHRDFSPAALRCDTAPFVAAFPGDLVEAEKAPKSKEDPRAKRIAALVERRRRWETKAKRAATALKKIDASLRRYARLGLYEGAKAAGRGKP